MTPHRLRRSFKFSRRLILDVILAGLSLALIVGVSVLTLYPHPNAKLLAEAPAALQGSVTH
jgi:hypothetical protein